MNAPITIDDPSIQTVQCPYCRDETIIALPENYAPEYVYCDVCTRKFIVERTASDFKLMTLEEAPCLSDPDCRAIEMGGGDEE